MSALLNMSASAECSTFVPMILDHIDGISWCFPSLAERAGEVRPGMRTSTFQKRTLVA